MPSFLIRTICKLQGWFHGILLLKETNLPEIVAYITWRIWANRNASRVGSPSLPLSQICKDALEQLNEFQAAIILSLLIAIVSHLTHWLPPPLLQLKANCDGAIFNGLDCAGLGIVIRNSKGLVIAALSEKVTLPPSMEDLEALAWQTSVTFAIELGL